MKKQGIKNFFKRQNPLKIMWVAGLLLWGSVFCAEAAVNPAFLYTLSNFSGPVSFGRVSFFVDEERNETYVLDLGAGLVRIFDSHGMEVYQFGEEVVTGRLVDVAVEKNGDILGLSKSIGKYSIVRFNFRGQPVSTFGLRNLPAGFSGFSPDRMGYRNGRLYLLDSSALKIVTADAAGRAQKGYDLVALLEFDEKKRSALDVGGFSVDRQGNMLFTIPVIFAAYSLSADGKVRGFGKPGSAPGKFGVVGGIAADGRGNYYVADRLRCVVLVFDKDFNFLSEFGYRGTRPQNLIGPTDLVLDNKNRLYVSQVRKRGVSVFEIRTP